MTLTLVDVGASGGLHPRWRKIGHRAVLFEPDPREYEHLKKASQPNVTVLNAALSDTPGHKTFYLCRQQTASSLYPPNVEFFRRFPRAQRVDVERTIEISTDTLDNQLALNGIHDVDFIKLDAQGHDLAILKGAATTLRRVICVEVEVLFAPLYHGQAFFSDLDPFVRSHGFELYDLRRYFWRRDQVGYGKGQIAAGEALYFRAPETVPAEKVEQARSIYLAYGYRDLAAALGRPSRAPLALPDFRGKGRIHNALLRLANVFASRNPYRGTDQQLGN